MRQRIVFLAMVLILGAAVFAQSPAPVAQQAPPLVTEVQNMFNALKVIWKTIKDLWEDMLLLVLMNGLTFVCGIPLFGAIVVPFYMGISSGSLTILIPSLLIALVVAIPASIPYAGAWFALNAVCNRVANGFAISWDFYFANFKQYIWKAWRYMIFSNSISILIIVNFLWYPQAFRDQVWVPWVMGAWLAAGLFWTAIQFYVIPFFIEQEDKSWRVALKNAALVAGANPLFTLVLLVLAVALLALSVAVIPPLFVLLGLVVWAMISTQAVVNRVAFYRVKLEAEQNKKQPKPKRDSYTR